MSITPPRWRRPPSGWRRYLQPRKKAVSGFFTHRTKEEWRSISTTESKICQRLTHTDGEVQGEKFFLREIKNKTVFPLPVLFSVFGHKNFKFLFPVSIHKVPDIPFFLGWRSFSTFSTEKDLISRNRCEKGVPGYGGDPGGWRSPPTPSPPSPPGALSVF